MTDPGLPRPEDERGHTYAKLNFHRLGKRVLKAIAKEMGLQSGTYDIRSNLAGCGSSGEVTLHGEHIYIQFSQTALGSDAGFMYRYCDGRKDSTGGCNNWMNWDTLLNFPNCVAEFMRAATRNGNGTL